MIALPPGFDLKCNEGPLASRGRESTAGKGDFKGGFSREGDSSWRSHFAPTAGRDSTRMSPPNRVKEREERGEKRKGVSAEREMREG